MDSAAERNRTFNPAQPTTPEGAPRGTAPADPASQAEQDEGPLVRLRRFHADDLSDLVAGCADPITQRFLPQLPSPYTAADGDWWINVGAPGAIAAGGSVFAFADPATDRLLGAGGYQRVHDGAAELGYWVAPWARRRGVASAAARLMCAHAFAAGLARLSLLTASENAASQRVAIAAGFVREGVQRQGGSVRGGGRADRIVWSRLAADPVPSRRLLPDLPGGHLTDGVITLAPLGAQDIEDTLRLRALPEVIETSVPPVAPTLERMRELCLNSESAWLAGERAQLTIRDAATDAYAGEIGLYYRSSLLGEAMIGYSTAPRWRRRGYTARAVRLLTCWAFDAVGLVRIVAGTAPGNVASQAVLASVGFEREGFHRALLPGRDGGRIDDVSWALLSPSSSTGRPPS